MKVETWKKLWLSSVLKTILWHFVRNNKYLSFLAPKHVVLVLQTTKIAITHFVLGTQINQWKAKSSLITKHGRNYLWVLTCKPLELGKSLKIFGWDFWLRHVKCSAELRDACREWFVSITTIFDPVQVLVCCVQLITNKTGSLLIARSDFSTDTHMWSEVEEGGGSGHLMVKKISRVAKLWKSCLRVAVRKSLRTPGLLLLFSYKRTHSDNIRRHLQL